MAHIPRCLLRQRLVSGRFHHRRSACKVYRDYAYVTKAHIAMDYSIT